MPSRQISIFELGVHDGQALSHMFSCDRPEYGRFFHPFPFTPETLSARLSAAQKDRYWGIRCGEKLAGFFMLRGWDEGFERPSFGVYIAEAFSRHGLAKLALQFALSWCRLNGVSAVMSKVHSDNASAKQIYEQAGFQCIGVCPETGHEILEKRWD